MKNYIFVEVGPSQYTGLITGPGPWAGPMAMATAMAMDMAMARAMAMTMARVSLSIPGPGPLKEEASPMGHVNLCQATYF